MKINNIDSIPELKEIEPGELLCLFRSNAAAPLLGGVKKVGNIFLYDNEMNYFDSIYQFHVWVSVAGQIWDSINTLESAVNAHKLAGMDFKQKPVEQWKVLEVPFKGDKMPSPQLITKKLQPFRKQKIDAIYLTNFLSIDKTKGINSLMQSITDTQSAKYDNETFLDMLINYNDLE